VPGEELRPRLQRLVDAVAPNIASVYDVHYDYLTWNTPNQLVRHDLAGLPAGRRNLMWMMSPSPPASKSPSASCIRP
jgi:hypothetical protein